MFLMVFVSFRSFASRKEGEWKSSLEFMELVQARAENITQ